MEGKSVLAGLFSQVGWLYGGLTQLLTAKVISWLSHTITKHISFQSHQLLFSHASAEVRGENTPERNFVSTGSKTHNHQVTEPPGWGLFSKGKLQLSLNVT